MSDHFDLLIDYNNRQAWEDTGWCELVDKFAVAFKWDGQPVALCEVAWPMEDDPEYGRLAVCYERAISEMDAVGAPYAYYPLVPVRFDFEEICGVQFLGAFTRFFNDNLRIIMVNAWFTEHCANDDDIVAILMHELLHAGLYGVDDPELKNGHGHLWYSWAEYLEQEYGYESLYDHGVA